MISFDFPHRESNLALESAANTFLRYLRRPAFDPHKGPDVEVLMRLSAFRREPAGMHQVFTQLDIT